MNATDRCAPFAGKADGDQAGSSSGVGPVVSCVTDDPSTLATYRWLAPAYPAAKAIIEPSGDQDGTVKFGSKLLPPGMEPRSTTWRAPVPSAFMTQIDPVDSSTNRIRVPSGAHLGSAEFPGPMVRNPDPSAFIT